ncbi:PKD domain-containing protein [Zobellia galactanivorans]|uniref:PKD domain-containing protein n=1 Tax=Zobellia galactanivorans (strain DSM 12802 / CCUG 47099 / CIP 106680 / NCIMB 13871 / Dsij) TaxID=63186 RepID=UPI0026E30026|nr:PKD domain-containing protein [Zobellia galactanivorans]MDO6807529.1 PKD domain-containing protein [Zobellia galactanivorans]
MKFHPTTEGKSYLWFVITFLIVIISCSKDTELLKDAVLSKPSQEVIDSETKETEEEIKEEESIAEEEEISDETETIEEVVYETRTTVFTPLHDAHVQSGKGYNQDLIRLEEGHRESYLMFDLSQIDSIGGYLEEARLEFTISNDDGSGTISVLKGDSTSWTEHNISEITAPKSDTILGSTTQNFEVNHTQEITLDQEKITPEVVTLILQHEDGNDLAFASKEHSSKEGPKLVVTYNAPQGAEAITPNDYNSPISPTDPEPTDSPEEDDELDEEETLDESPTKEDPKDTPTSTENQAPIAIVDASTVSGTIPLKVTFTGKNSSDDQEVKNYGWNFGDGSSSNEINPVHTFEKAGSFKVTLTVQDAQGEFDTEEIIITAKTKENTSPTAVANATPISGEAPLTVDFNGKESSDDEEVASYTWDFKDGDKGSSSSTSHSFTEPGTYEVLLTVKDNDGLTDTDVVTITVSEKENKAPTAKASSNTSKGEAPLEIQFKGSGSTDDKAIKSYFWDFKDGSTSTSSNPSHTFTDKGTYTVSLTVTDEEGLKDSDTITVTITETENQAPVAVASGTPLTGDAPLNVQFSSGKSEDDKGITGYFWDFKDGSTTTNQNPSHSFSEPGTYQVELSVKDKEGLTHSTTIEVKVNSRPVDTGGDTGNGGNTGGGDSGSGGNTGGGDTGGGSSNGGSSGNYPSNAVFASSFGFKSGDATAAFEAAIKSGSSYVVIDKQSSDWVIEPMKFFNLRDMTIVFEAGVVLRAKPGAYGGVSDHIFQMVSPTNITIEGNGATFQMNKSEYTSGEGRHGLSIYGGKDIKISDLIIKDTGGDGIFITRTSSKTFSENITLTNITSQNNRRQGMSITSGENIYIRNCKFINTSGTKPEAGVDLEPDYPYERLVNINFSNCQFSGNDSSGFHLATLKMNSSSTPISVKVTDSEFSHNMKSPSEGVTGTEIYLSQGATNNPVKGEIRFERIQFNGSTDRIIFSRKAHDSFKVVFKDCIAKNIGTNESRGLIELQASSTETSLGGFVFENFRMEYNKNVPFMEINAPNSNFTVRDISGSFTIVEPNNNPLKYSGGYKSSNNVNVSINYTHL